MLGGNGGLFESSASLLADAWSERTSSASLQPGGGGGVTAHQQRNRFPEYNSALVARTLMQHSAPQATRQTKKDSVGATALPAPPLLPTTQTPVGAATTSPDDDAINYCDAYPNTNTTQVDWALYAAHRVAGVIGVELEKGKANAAAAAQERNLWAIFFGKCGGDRRYKNDQRGELLEKLTLQGILLAMFVPQQLVQYFNSIAAQHTRLHLAARQCVAQVDYNLDTLKNRAAHERDLLIKRILFHADNGQTECRFSIDSHLEFRNQVSWSQYTLDSVKEADLFGRAIGVLVHQVLQSPSLRVKAADCGSGGNGGASAGGKKIDLILSWKAALDNLRPRDTDVRAGATPTLSSLGEQEPKDAQPARKEVMESAATRHEAPAKSGSSAASVASRAAAPYLPNPLFDNETFIAYGSPSSATRTRPTTTGAATTTTGATTTATAVAATVADDAKSVNSGGETAFF